MNMPGIDSKFPRQLRLGFLGGTALAVGLTIYGAILVPASLDGSGGWISILAAVGILLVYAAVGFWGIPAAWRAYPQSLRLSVQFGLAAGAIFAAEIILEYLLLPDTRTNTWMGYAEFGGVFILFFIAGWLGARRSGKLRAGLQAAFWCALLASLLWLNVLLLTHYAFHGTLRQVLVLKAEGTYEDYVSSGIQSFDAFVIQDLRGAGFYHLILGPLIATILGGAAGIIQFIIGKLWKTHLTKLEG